MSDATQKGQAGELFPLKGQSKLYKQGIRSNALRVYVMVGLLGLMGAYAAGSGRQLRTSIYVFALVTVVVVFVFLQILLFLSAESVHSPELLWPASRLKGSFQPLSSLSRWLDGKRDDDDRYVKSTYLMLLGILGTSVTYQEGLAPPGGTWGEPPSLSPSPSASPPSVAGNPILLQSNPRVHCEEEARRAVVGAAGRRGVGPVRPARRLCCRQLQGHRDVRVCITLVGVVVVFIAIYVLLSFDVVQGRANKLMVCKYFSRMMEERVWRHLGVSNGDDQSAASSASV
ncbi:hypothetical protein D1007_50293 [Hordeum vulgare]|nr:hypothetical protein D1007_50293 [Hordeum vulgare]